MNDEPKTQADRTTPSGGTHAAGAFRRAAGRYRSVLDTLPVGGGTVWEIDHAPAVSGHGVFVHTVSRADPILPDPFGTPVAVDGRNLEYDLHAPANPGGVTFLYGPGGRPTFAVVPWDTWTGMLAELEDRADAATFDAARADETFPAEVVDRLMAGDAPIKVFREYRRLTQKALAAAVGTSSVYISQIERGERAGGTTLLKKIAAALGVSLDDIV